MLLKNLPTNKLGWRVERQRPKDDLPFIDVVIVSFQISLDAVALFESLGFQINTNKRMPIFQIL